MSIKLVIFDLDGTLIRLPIRYEVIFEKLQNLFDTQDEFKPLIPTILEVYVKAMLLGRQHQFI